MESRIGAWSSKQSEELIKREDLIKNISYFTKKFKKTKVNRPSHWTGFRVEPNLIEFWQDMPFRLHDRLEFKKHNQHWAIRKLYP